MIDSYIYVIVALLPLTASLLVFQANPYKALVMRGILGAVAALVYSVLGAADVALTEALVGTMLAITLYAIAVRSSLVMRMGILKEEITSQTQNSSFSKLIEQLRTVIRHHHLHLELIPYVNLEALQQGLTEKEVHAICTPSESGESINSDRCFYQTVVRVHRLYEILVNELKSPEISLTYVNPTPTEEKH